MEIAWFGPMIPLLALLNYWFVPAAIIVVFLLVVLALIEDMSLSRRP